MFGDVITTLDTTGYLPYVGYVGYPALLVGLWVVMGKVRAYQEGRASDREKTAPNSGEPETLHPIINPEICVGCGACTNACPEGKIIDMIAGKARLVDPASCIGHGACKTACPVGAIELVFGTARRGVDIPVVKPSFESNVPGLYIAGELGGMGLIANAVEQGRQAIGSIAKRNDLGKPGLYDVVIVGGGPAGIAASLAAKQAKLRTLTLEQDTLGGTVARYPRKKLIMTRPAKLPLHGKMYFKRVRKERLLEFWQTVLLKTRIEIREGVRVERITPTPDGFELATSAGPARASTVLLATGRRGSPRKLGVPGEELSKVVYSLDDPNQYRDQHVLVVGGGDSALEAAFELSRYPVGSVTLSYRGKSLNRAKPILRQRCEEAIETGQLHVLMESNVRHIAPDRVVLEQPSRRRTLRNDAVIVCAGGVLPTELLASVGVEVTQKFGAA